MGRAAVVYTTLPAIVEITIARSTGRDSKVNGRPFDDRPLTLRQGRVGLSGLEHDPGRVWRMILNQEPGAWWRFSLFPRRFHYFASTAPGAKR